jgi:phosphatidylserine synthase
MTKPTKYQLFLIDAIEALVSILLLWVIYLFDEFFGMPPGILKLFMCIASCCLVYSTTVYLIRPTHWKLYLKIIAGMNLAYCLITIHQTVQNWESLTLYGRPYFIVEIIVILALSAYEINYARTHPDTIPTQG